MTRFFLAPLAAVALALALPASAAAPERVPSTLKPDALSAMCLLPLVKLPNGS